MEYIGIQKKNGGVVEALQQAILSGQIPAGTEMTQNELAESLGVSRMPVREALMILEYQGLIILSLIHISEPTRRYCVSRMPSSA